MRENRPAGHYYAMSNQHLDDHDLERYYLGQIEDEEELANLEEHYLGCPRCAERVAEIEDEVEAIQVRLLRLAEANGEMLDPGLRRLKRTCACDRTSPALRFKLFH
jgi:anti-sigma factor RsiW